MSVCFLSRCYYWSDVSCKGLSQEPTIVAAQFQGKPVVYADGVGDLTKVIDQDTDDDISKFMDWLQVYPVLKVSFRGRIL